jgi:hypothetical protein
MSTNYLSRSAAIVSTTVLPSRESGWNTWGRGLKVFTLQANWYGVSDVDYQANFDNLAGLGYRPVDLCGFTVASQDLYTGVFVQMPGPDWVARHGLSAAEYQQEFDILVAQGYRLTHVSGY